MTTVEPKNEAAEACPRQARPAKTASEQLERLKGRLAQKGINPVFGMVVYAFDCKHDEKASYHVDFVSTGTQGITAEGRTLVIASLENILASWKKGTE